MADDKKRCGFGTYVAYCECLLDNINNLNAILATMVSSYRLLVGSAEEFNRITLAHKGDLEDAIDRADDLGDIIDKIICRIDRLVSVYLDICLQEILCPDIIPEHGGSEVNISDQLENEIAANLGAGIIGNEIDIAEELEP